MSTRDGYQPSRLTVELQPCFQVVFYRHNSTLTGLADRGWQINVIRFDVLPSELITLFATYTRKPTDQDVRSYLVRCGIDQVDHFIWCQWSRGSDQLLVHD